MWTFSKTWIWPTDWSPNEMLCNINDGHTIFKDNPMVLLTPLGRDGLPIEVPHAVYMIAFVDTKVFVITAKATCYFPTTVKC